MFFTVVLEFEGVTSVSQLTAKSANSALLKWREALTNPRGYGLTVEQGRRISRALDGGVRRKPVMLNGITNVWCQTVLAGREGIALFNIIATVPPHRLRRKEGGRKTRPEGIGKTDEAPRRTKTRKSG